MKIGLSSQVIQKIKGVFSSHPEVEAVILYGSRAMGNFKAGSDVDLTLKGTGLNLSKLAKISGEMDDLSLPYTFDFSIHSQIKNPELLEHIDRAGTVFYSSYE